MNLDLITKNDLNDFKLELVNLITDIISKSQPKKKEILSNEDVKDLLGISTCNVIVAIVP